MSSSPTPAESATWHIDLKISVREPFDWSQSLRFIRDFPSTRDEQVVDDTGLVKAWRFADQTVVSRIQSADDGGALGVELASPAEITDAVSAAAVDRISFYLSADDDLREFDQTARRDPAFAPIAARLRGYHQVKFPSPVENVVWSILSQRNPMKVAREAKIRLMRRLNEPVEAFGSTLLPCPSIEQLATLSEAELAELVRNERKAKYLFGSVARLAEIDESFLRHADYREVSEALLTFPGIGPWSATFVLIRGLGRMEVLPRDGEILRAAQNAYGRSLSEEDLVILSAPYAPNQGYWAHYLRAGQ